MELLCIDNQYSENYIQVWESYPLVNDKCDCRCKGFLDVGIRREVEYTITGGIMRIGDPYRCAICETELIWNGIIWLEEWHFAQIATEDEVREKELVNIETA